MRETIGRIRRYMDHSRLLRKLVPVARKLGLIHLLHWLVELMDGHHEPGERELQAKEFFAAHRDDFEKLDGMLEDQLSRDTLRSVMEYRQTGRMSALKGVIRQPQYFQKDIFGPVKDEVFVDGGAYTGDTIESYLTDFVGGGYLQKNICLGAR